MNKLMITNIKIANFRSIINLDIKIDEKNGFVSFCGANNVGKTNILNALSLFFDKIEYIPEKDCPNHKFYGTQGGSYQPKITITFKDNIDSYQITKDWNLTKHTKKDSDILFNISGKKK
ncbi:MAG: AAA family ATPase [Sulfurovaceae bacterium]|nr:AAA family ATPase [Sulfurovaceae bacterium]